MSSTSSSSSGTASCLTGLSIADRVAELEAQLKQARIETKAIGKQVHDALAAWSKEMDDHKAHEIAKQNRKSLLTITED